MEADDSFARSLWAATAPPPPPTGPLDGEISVDIAIVGGGLAGVSTALAAAEAGAAVQLVEARVLGHGASGRNAGVVAPAFAKLGPAEMAARLARMGDGQGDERGNERGDERADTYVRLVGAGGAALFDLIRRLGLSCGANQAGWLLPAHRPNRMRGLEARVAEWAAFGRRVELLDAAETARRTGSPLFHGAILDETGGWVDPLALVRGLGEAALAAGARIATGSPATALHRSMGRWQVVTSGGRVTADRVLLAVNGQSGGLVPEVDRSLVPLTVFESATSPLSGEEAEAVLPGAQAFSDTRMNLFSARPTPDGRLVTGGMAVLPTEGALGRVQPRMLARLKHHFPALEADAFAYAWSGTASLTGDFVPRLFRVGPEAYALSACNGRGIVANVALGQALGRTLATVGDGLEAALPLPPTAPYPRRLARALRWVPGLLLPWYDLRDRW